MTKIAKITKNKKLPMHPCGNCVLIKPDDVLKTTESGIVTGTENEHDREEVAKVEGTLMAIGSCAWKDYGDGSPWAKVGDKVFFKRHVSDRIEDKNDIVNGKPQRYFLMSDIDVLAIIEEA